MKRLVNENFGLKIRPQRFNPPSGVANKGRRPKKAAKLFNSLKHVDLDKELILGGERTSSPPLRPPGV
jgi:hypothetical protein